MKPYKSLKGKKKFREVIKKGRRYNRSEIQLIVLQVANETGKENNLLHNGINIGIQIGKKFGNAVTRNRAKRKIKAICSEVLQKVDNDFIIVIRPGENFKSLNYSNSKYIIISLLTKAGLLKS